MSCTPITSRNLIGLIEGAGFSPPKFLVPGDKVEIEIERIGKLTNTVQ